MSNTRRPSAPPSATLRSAPDLPAGLRAVPAAEMTPEREAAMALEMQQAQQRQIHDNLEALLADPAAFVQKLPEIFGPAIADMVAAGVRQAVAALGVLPVKAAGRVCGTCLALRLQWNGRHKDELERSQSRAMMHAGVTDQADPRMAQLDVTPFLPENLRTGAGPEGMPVLYDSITTVNGNEVCPQHHPAVPQQQAGGSLILMPGIPVHAAARIAMGGQPGMPGMAAG